MHYAPLWKLRSNHKHPQDYCILSWWMKNNCSGFIAGQGEGFFSKCTRLVPNLIVGFRPSNAFLCLTVLGPLLHTSAEISFWSPRADSTTLNCDDEYTPDPHETWEEDVDHPQLVQTENSSCGDVRYSDKQPRWAPLPTTNSIRLLYLVKGVGTGEIVCDLHVSQIHSSDVAYEALSYTWGDPQSKKVKIACFGKGHVSVLSRRMIRINGLGWSSWDSCSCEIALLKGYAKVWRTVGNTECIDKYHMLLGLKECAQTEATSSPYWCLVGTIITAL